MARSVRERFQSAIDGEYVERPVYAAYDWFAKNRPAVNWEKLFELGLGLIGHANVIRHEHPNFEIIEETKDINGRIRKDTRIITDRGELSQWHDGEWLQDHFIKTPEDYRIMARALEGVKVFTDDSAFFASEKEIGDNGITLGQIQGFGNGRTPLMVLQIDWVGLEQWSLDLATELPEMMDLLEIMNAIKLEEIRGASRSSARQLKLWENLSIETMGPVVFRKHLVPLYNEILDILEGHDKRVSVHYDGQLRIIADDIAELDFDGIDSFTEAPEGNVTLEEARAWWPDKFLWIHPNLGLYHNLDTLPGEIRRLRKAVGDTRSCYMISEEVPPQWEKTIPAILKTLEE